MSYRRGVIQGRGDIEAERLAFMIKHMSANKAYVYAIEQATEDQDSELLEVFRERFRQYRFGWRENPRYAIEHKLHHDTFRAVGFQPLCVDIETAALCDLACPFCYRQSIATPDKIISEELYYRLIDQCAELGVPSVKLNWRGEPLLHPKLPQFVDYAKRSGILETIINTNAVTLDEKKSRELIEAGLDLLIYSFDGGTKETYERMRVGRFRDNHFEEVYGNIRQFARIRESLGAVLPRTKIQMILTEQTFQEQESFFALFSDCVDYVSVKAYSERGGRLSDLDQEIQKQLADFLDEKQLSKTSAYWRDIYGSLFLASCRIPCEQPYQRLMISCDGRVSMCCYDWGCEYPIGYVDSLAFERGDREYETVLEKAKSGAKGYEYLSQMKMPERYIEPPKRVQALQDIWYGDLVNAVRQKHVEGLIEEVPICRRCPFKETYQWIKVEVANGSGNNS